MPRQIEDIEELEIDQIIQEYLDSLNDEYIFDHISVFESDDETYYESYEYY